MVSILTISSQSTCHSAKFYPNRTILSRKNDVVSIFKMADLSHLGFYGSIRPNGFLKRTSYRSSIETIAPFRLPHGTRSSAIAERPRDASCVEYFGQSLKAALSRKINMVTFANLGSVRLPSLKFVGLRVRKIRRIQCLGCLSTTVSQLFEPQLKNIVNFTYPGLHFLLALETPLRQSRKTLHE